MRSLEKLGAAGLIETTKPDSIHVTRRADELREVLGVSLTELAAADPETSLRITPLFGPALDTGRTNDVFVLMPFCHELSPVYEDHIKRVVARLGLSVARADDVFTTSSIMDEIWTAIVGARVLIADCTGRNPNVFYETGIAHTLGKPVVLITQHSEDVPFDLRHRRYVEYQFTPRGMAEFEDRLEKTLVEVTHSFSEA
jgi:hypothetical protein